MKNEAIVSGQEDLIKEEEYLIKVLKVKIKEKK